MAGLQDRSRRTHHSPNRKLFARETERILGLRRERRPGVRLRIELIREHGLKLALDTVHKLLVRHDQRYLRRRPLRREATRRYGRAIPGDRIHLDGGKTGPGLYQYTAGDDCSRFQVQGLHPRRTAANTPAFLEQVLRGSSPAVRLAAPLPTSDNPSAGDRATAGLPRTAILPRPAGQESINRWVVEPGFQQAVLTNETSSMETLAVGSPAPSMSIGAIVARPRQGD